MALAKKTNQRPGSVVASRQVAIEGFYVTSSTVDFSVVQPQGTIIESVHVFFDGLTTLADGDASAGDGDASLTIGTNSNFAGTEAVTSTSIVDFSADPSLEDGKVVSATSNIAAAMQANATTADRVLFGQITCGDASTITGTNKLQIHIGFRHF